MKYFLRLKIVNFRRVSRWHMHYLILAYALFVETNTCPKFVEIFPDIALRTSHGIFNNGVCIFQWYQEKEI